MILMNDFRRQWEDVRTDILRITEDVGSSGWYILGERVLNFETSLASYWSIAHAVGVASGLDAIEISLRVLGCKAGDRVLTSPISALGTVMAILRIGAIPLLVDCDSFGLIDLEECRAFLKHGTGVRFFVPVHLYGHALDSTALRNLRDEFQLLIVEDCAQSVGAAFRGEKTGKVGQLSATSFYPTKNLGALGDGGAVLTDLRDAADQGRILRGYGDSRLDELQAAYLDSAFLPRLDAWTQRRRHVARRYCDELDNPQIHCCGSPVGSNSCWHLFPVILDPAHKTAFVHHLCQRGIQSAEHFPLALVEQEALRPSMIETASDCANAIRFCHSEVSLPIHPFLTDDEITTVVHACNSWRP